MSPTGDEERGEVMGYVEANLLPGEEIVHRGKIHWAVYIRHAFVVLAGVGVTVNWVEFLPMLLIICAVVGIAAAIRRQTTEMVVTTRRVIMKTGWLSRRTVELNLSKVETLAIDQGLLGRMLNYGTVTVVGTGGTKEPFKYVDAPISFRKTVQQITAAS